MRTALCWFRRDLRLGDHPALATALAQGDRVVPVVFDPEQLAWTWAGDKPLALLLAGSAPWTTACVAGDAT